MFDNYLIASEYGFNGVYRAKLLTAVDDSDIRVYVPGINSVNPLDSNGNVDMSKYEKNKLSYPVVQWCCYNLESKELVNIEGPAWVMFENGDVQRPVCISYAVIGGEGESSGANTSINYSPSSNAYELVVEKEVDALFTAYYSTPDSYSTAENRLQGGPIAANGETLDYTKLTCAAPKEIAFNTYIQVMNTNTSQDNVIYRVNDRGGAITIDNNVYHFDLLMKDKETAYSFGKVKGKAKIGTVLTLKNQSSNSDVVNKAIKLGYKIINKKVPYVWGGKSMSGFDCSGFVWYCYHNSNGGNLSSLSYAMTTEMKTVYSNAGFKDVINEVNLSSGSGLLIGDILVSTTHTTIYVGGGKIIGAHDPDIGIKESLYKYGTHDGNTYNVVLRYGG